jgi:hypothetical protein
MSASGGGGMSRRDRRLARAGGIPGAGLTHWSRRRPWRPLAALAAAILAVTFLHAACGERGPAGADDPSRPDGTRTRPRPGAGEGRRPGGPRREFVDAAHDPLDRLVARWQSEIEGSASSRGQAGR